MHNLNVLLTALVFAVTPFPIADSIRSSSTSSNLQFLEPGGGLSHVKEEHAVPRFLLKLYRQRHYPARKNSRNTITAFFLEGKLGEMNQCSSKHYHLLNALAVDICLFVIT